MARQNRRWRATTLLARPSCLAENRWSAAGGRRATASFLGKPVPGRDSVARLWRAAGHRPGTRFMKVPLMDLKFMKVPLMKLAATHPSKESRCR